MASRLVRRDPKNPRCGGDSRGEAEAWRHEGKSWTAAQAAERAALRLPFLPQSPAWRTGSPQACAAFSSSPICAARSSGSRSVLRCASACDLRRRCVGRRGRMPWPTLTGWSETPRRSRKQERVKATRAPACEAYSAPGRDAREGGATGETANRHHALWPLRFFRRFSPVFGCSSLPKHFGSLLWPYI